MLLAGRRHALITLFGRSRLIALPVACSSRTMLYRRQSLSAHRSHQSSTLPDAAVSTDA